VRTIFAQPDRQATRDQVFFVADMLRERHPAVSDLLLEAEASDSMRLFVVLGSDPSGVAESALIWFLPGWPRMRRMSEGSAHAP
jgi:hypothetical protein